MGIQQRKFIENKLRIKIAPQKMVAKQGLYYSTKFDELLVVIGFTIITKSKPKGILFTPEGLIKALRMMRADFVGVL